MKPETKDMLLRVLSILITVYGGFSQEYIILVGGVFLFLLSYSNEVEDLDDRINKLEEKLQLHREIDKIGLEVDSLKDRLKKGKGYLSASATIIIILIILFLIWLWQKGYIKLPG